MCTATSSSPMCLNIFLFPVCLSRTSMQLSPASYPRKKSRNFSIRCMKPTGWCPTHRDASLQASVEPWPFFVCAQLSSGLWERQKVPGVSLHSWHPMLTFTVLSRIRFLSYTHPYRPREPSPKWTSSFLCCCARRPKRLPSAAAPSVP